MGDIMSLISMLGGGGGGGGGYKKKSYKKFKADTSGGVLGEYSGQIKSFAKKGGYGFIECADLAEHGDIFLHWDEIKGYKKGQTVKFTAFLNKEGKAQAKDVKSGLKELVKPHECNGQPVV